MNNIEHYKLMAKYNQWMNKSLYAVCARIPDNERKQDQGAFFKSIHGTLNHILWADTAWLRRFTNVPLNLTRMGEDLFEDFDELTAEREKTDDQIQDWVAGLDNDWLGRSFSFTSVSDKKTRTAPAWKFVSHMFNHQSHHRGQVTTLLNQSGYEPPVTDIPWMPGVLE